MSSSGRTAKHVSYISEKDGFAHLYKTAVDGSSTTALTNGRFEVREASLSRDGKTIYLTTSEEHPGEIHFYSMPAAGGPRTKITGMTGFNEPTLSPDESTLVLLHSDGDGAAGDLRPAEQARSQSRGRYALHDRRIPLPGMA